MVPVCRQSGHMVQVCTAMGCLMAVTECLMAAGVAEALALDLAEVLVGAGAEAAAEADLVIGSRFKLAFNCGKDGYYAKR